MARSKEDDAKRKRDERAKKAAVDQEKLAERIKAQRSELLPYQIATAAVAFRDDVDRAATFLGILFESPKERKALLAAARLELKAMKGNELEQTSREVRVLIGNLARMTHAAAATGQIEAKDYSNTAMRWSIVAKNYLPATADDFDASDLIDVEPLRPEEEELEAAARWEKKRAARKSLTNDRSAG